MDLKKIVINTKIWVDSAQDRNYWRDFVNMALTIKIRNKKNMYYLHNGMEHVLCDVSAG